MMSATFSIQRMGVLPIRELPQYCGLCADFIDRHVLDHGRRKFVCTTNPEELAWFMGLEMKDLKKGAKPADLELIECSEDWSHNGTPQWVCKEEKEEVADEAGCEVIGETADEVWFACADSTSGGDGVECSEEDFGVGGGPGILPQDGEVLCKQKKTYSR